MIISASRRTDIPAFFSEWLYNRLREGFALARNPIRWHQVSLVSLRPGDVDGIVFWTKNPGPMMARLGELKGHMYCFQFTVTPYGPEVEPGFPGKAGQAIETFKRLSGAIGPERVIWRYDPILANDSYPLESHLGSFEKFAGHLACHTRKVVFSFIDTGYREVRRNAKELALRELTPESQHWLAERLAWIARGHGLEIEACAEKTDFGKYGIGRGRCVDSSLFGKLLGRPLAISKDKGQRKECGCDESFDIGMYNTCQNGCLYCYASRDRQAIGRNVACHDPLSPLMAGQVGEGDKITARQPKPGRPNRAK
ncbi:MAG: DUF1848 domain-containing protein [Deltaproteobacteria bacterium]|jgi:hypothetical protein|nr:DUF1848 domain-containing protein [Deltaproteobacteria bacterium]